jgi:hypothetical protein
MLDASTGQNIIIVTRRVPLMEQEMLTLSGVLDIFVGSSWSIFSFLCNVLYTIVFPFVLFSLAIIQCTCIVFPSI